MREIFEGRTVRYVQAPGEYRAAVVVKHWGGGTCNLFVFCNGAKDEPGKIGELKTSVPYLTPAQAEKENHPGLGTWHDLDDVE